MLLLLLLTSSHIIIAETSRPLRLNSLLQSASRKKRGGHEGQGIMSHISSYKYFTGI